mgnify:CR=1 FL=1
MDVRLIIETLYVFIFALLLGMIVIPRILLISFKRRLFDQLDSRKVHHGKVPRLGGTAFFPSIALAVFSVIIIHDKVFRGNLLDVSLTVQLMTTCCSLFLLYVTGIMDDLIGVRYSSKFLIQGICGVLTVTSDLYINNFYGLFGIYEIPIWIGAPLTVVIVIYILNAINLIDGIDGLASGLSGVTLLSLGCIFIYLHEYLFSFFAFASLGVLIPFFYYNVFGRVERKRKIFMGDTGSLTIGLILSVLTIKLSMYEPSKEMQLPGAIVIAFSFLLVPMLDVIRVFLHRLREGKNPFQPDKNHIHHKFIALGFPQRRVMITIVGISIMYSIINVCAIHFIPITALFMLNLATWTIMHILITRKINQIKESKKDAI